MDRLFIGGFCRRLVRDCRCAAGIRPGIVECAALAIEATLLIVLPVLMSATAVVLWNRHRIALATAIIAQSARLQFQRLGC
jgi:hypothetical protein